MITALLIICAIVFILALLYILGCLLEKHMLSRQKKYQDHIDDLVEELFPPSITDTATIQTPAVNTSTVNTTTTYESDTEYREAKRKMVANIRTYFNQRKLDASIRDTEIAIREAEIKTGLPMNSPMFSSRPDTRSFPTHPSLQRILE